MASNEEFEKATSYANKILNNRENIKKKQVDTQGKLKFILCIVGVLAVIAIIVYIVYTAYSVPEPLDILSEVKQLLNQIPPR